MSATENKNVVLRFFENLSAGRLDAALDLMDENAMWWVSGNPEYIPLAGRYGKNENVGMVAMVGAAMPNGIELTVNSSTEEEERVAVEARDGGIWSVREYFDTIHTNEVLFDTTYADEGQ